MTQNEKTRKLPGAWLLQFAEKYFEQPGLEKIALPVIADLQHEYASEQVQSKPRFLKLLRGYLSFWKTIGLYSILSSEGNIRTFKSIHFVVFLGVAIGAIFSVISWKGYQTSGHISTFPDSFTMLAFFVSLFLAIWFSARQIQVHCYLDILRVTNKITAAAGIILGLGETLLCFRMWHIPYSSLVTDLVPLAIVFLVNFFFVQVVFGVIASLLVQGMYTVGKQNTGT